MELVQEHVRRALTYLRMLNDQGVEPTREQVENFASSPGPQGAVYESALFSQVSGVMSVLARQRKVSDAEPVVGYVLRMQWVAEPTDGLLRLTDLGQVLLRGLETEAPTSIVADVVLEPTDPLVWVSLTRVAASAGKGLLVDAYFKVDFVPWLIETTALRRLLLSSRHPQAARDLSLLAVALGTVAHAGDLQVRSTGDPGLHDRCIIGDDDRVLLLGTSINGVGRSMTAVIAPDDEVMRVYRNRYEVMWANATTVEPQRPGAAPSPPPGASGPSSPATPATGI